MSLFFIMFAINYELDLRINIIRQDRNREKDIVTFGIIKIITNK